MLKEDGKQHRVERNVKIRQVTKRNMDAGYKWETQQKKMELRGLGRKRNKIEWNGSVRQETEQNRMEWEG